MCWSFVKATGKYATEISTIQAYIQKTRRLARCPKCRECRTTHEMTKRAFISNENEITHWNYRCGCGAEIIIFND